jgi:L-fuconolactonase
MQRIDSHQHFWQLARGDYTWLRPDVPGLAPIYRDFLPEHLQPQLASHRVAQTVLVQAADSEQETEFLLDLAGRHAFVAGVVGWTDLSKPDAAATLERWARNPKFKGVRPMLQDLPADDWIAHAPHPEAVRALLRLGLRLDALVQPRHLQPLLQFIRSYPELPIVIDHAAKPQLAQGWGEAWAGTWRSTLGQIAAQPQVVCKFSGLLTEMAAPVERSEAANLAALRPVWDKLLQWFGPARLMWGSDWPVLNLNGDYLLWHAVANALLAALSDAERAAVFGGNAAAFYRL